MPYVDPGAVTTGTTITSTWGNAVRNAEQFLANPPACRVRHSANQSYASSATATAALFNTERWDTDTMHDTVTNTSRITIKTAGLYVVGGNGYFQANTAGARFVGIRANGSQWIATSQHPAEVAALVGYMNISATWKFAVNDYVELMFAQNSGATLNLTADAALASPEFWATWVGQG